MSEQIYLARNGQQSGPYTRAQLAERAAQGSILESDHAWIPGQAEWRPAGELLQELGIPLPRPLAAPPPVPSAPRGRRMVPEAVNVPAGHLARFGANLLDGLVCSAFFLVAAVVVGLVAGFGDGSDDDIGAMVGYGYLISVVLMVLYFSLSHSGSSMATLGKRAAGLVVVGKDGQRIDFGRALARYIALLLLSLLWLPLLVILFTRRHQGLHDMLAGTVVVQKRSYDPADWNYEEMRGESSAVALLLIGFFVGIPMIGIFAAIAIPAYQDYTIRAKVSGALAEAGEIKVRVAEALLTGEDAVVSYDELGLPGPKDLPQFGARIEVQPDGVVLVRFDSPQPVAGMAVALTPIEGGAGGWHCSGVDEMPPRYLPVQCREGTGSP